VKYVPQAQASCGSGRWTRLDREQSVLRTAADVEQAIEVARSRVVLSLESDGHISDVEARVKSEASACGCVSAAVAASLAFFAYLGVVLVVVGTPPHWGASELLWGIAVVVGAALVGKALGLVRARRRWLGELGQVRAQVAMPDDRGDA
jgi:hypothetical protein